MNAIVLKFTVTILLVSVMTFMPLIQASDTYSPYVHQSYPTTAYWGDTHLHTNLSTDSYLYENRLTADEAYRFARGSTIKTNNGQQARLSRPLDFLVIADHANNVGGGSTVNVEGATYPNTIGDPELATVW